MSRVQLGESKLRARRRKRRVAVLAVWVVLALIFLGAIVGLTYLPHYRIASVEVAGVEGTEAQAVEELVQEKLDGRYFFLFPRDNVMLYPQDAIAAALLKEYPTFAQAEVEADGLRALSITITKRVPKAVWCGASLSNKAPCLTLDQGGVAYQPAAQFDGTVYTTYYGALAEGTLPRQYLTEEGFRSLVALAAALEGHEKMQVASIAVDSVGDVELFFTNGFELMFALEDGGGDVFERFVLALEAEPFAGHSTAEFEYLDLRFGDRLYYRLKTD